MESEVDDLGLDVTSPVSISITRPSASEDEEEQETDERIQSHSDTMDLEDSVMEEDHDSGKRQSDELEKKNEENDSVTDASQNGVTLDDSDGKSQSGKAPTLEMVGDRVLIERDGKFELVDASEIKAEYFEMLGLEKGQEEVDSSVRKSENNSEISDDKSFSDETNTVQRPKTSGFDRTSPTSSKKKSPVSSRSHSAKPLRRNEEFSYIKSRYAMTEQQLQIKKKREEAIARRKKEEEERALEEHKRKREDAERAFEVGCKLNAKTFSRKIKNL